ncbi:MAG: SHOCT domain-containing protein [Kiritimatiellae bacterium]|nr:SHOCT domain-containing protein [Kiritimatiellia bacterium]
MNCKTSLHIAFAAALLLALGTGCASFVGEPPKPNPVQDAVALPEVVAEPAVANVSPEPQAPEEDVDNPSAPSPTPSPKPAVPAAKPALKRTPQTEHAGYMSKTPVALPPSAKPNGSLTRLDEMKKRGTMSEDEYGQMKRQILENPE